MSYCNYKIAVDVNIVRMMVISTAHDALHVFSQLTQAALNLPQIIKILNDSIKVWMLLTVIEQNVMGSLLTGVMVGCERANLKRLSSQARTG